MAAIVPAIGTFRLGGAALGTASGGSSAGAGGGGGGTANLLMLEANDRYQVIGLIRNGTSDVPLWVYWNPAPAPWAEVLAAPNPADYPDFFAVDGAGAYPDASVESPLWEAGDDQEVQVSGVYVRFAVRPTIMDSYDGGVGGVDPTFTVKMRGWGVPGVDLDGSDTLATQVVTSAACTWSTSDADVSRDPWPAHRSVWLPARLEQSVTSYQVLVTNAFGVEFLSFRPVGVRRSRRAGG